MPSAPCALPLQTTMKILHVTNANIGGAWIAAHRLHTALRKAGVDSRMLVRTKGSEDPFVTEVGDQGSGGREQSAEGREHRAERREQSAESIEQSEESHAPCAMPSAPRSPLHASPRSVHSSDPKAYGLWPKALSTSLAVRGRGWLGAKLTRALGMEGCSLNIFPTGLHKVLNASDADVIHLHWINNEMISIKEIAKIKKPLVWTLHDMWPLCGAEHFPGWATGRGGGVEEVRACGGSGVEDRTFYHEAHELHEKENLDGMNRIDRIRRKKAAGRRLQAAGRQSYPKPLISNFKSQISGLKSHPKASSLRSKVSSAINTWIFKRKQKAWRNLRVHFVAPSRWMAEQVRKSELFADAPVTVIPNTLDLEIFKPMDQAECRRKRGLPLDKKLILFGAHDPLDPNKGVDLLEKALQELPEEDRGCIGVVVFGCKGEWKIGGLETYWLGAVAGEREMAEVYNAGDVICVPSRRESFGQTAAEAMSCGVPAVAFRTGGLIDIIDHKQNGWLAEPFEPKSLAEGILWSPGVSESGSGDLRKQDQGSEGSDQTAGILGTCREKAENMFSAEPVANQYQSVYRESMERGGEKGFRP